MLFCSVQNLGWMVKVQEQNTNEVISKEIEKKDRVQEGQAHQSRVKIR